MKTIFATFTSLKSRIALQVARKISFCDSALRCWLFHVSNIVQNDE